MKKTIRAAAALGAAMIAGLALSGCPTQPIYPSTITPVYAATSSGSLYVYNGSSWTPYPSTDTGSTSLSSVVVSGSGSGALVFVGGTSGVSQFDGTTWTPLNSGLGTAPVNNLFLGSDLYAATAGGVSVLNVDLQSWTNDGTVPSVNGVFSLGPYTFVAADKLYVYNGTSQISGSPYLATSIISASTKVQSIFVDSYLDIVAGTDKGLAVLNAGSSTWSSNLLPVQHVGEWPMDGH